MPEILPIHPQRLTTDQAKEEALRAARELIAITEHLVEMLEANPSADQWRVLESIAQGYGTSLVPRMMDPIRRGRSAAVLIAAAEKAAQARREQLHRDQEALVLHLERHGFAQDAQFLGGQA